MKKVFWRTCILCILLTVFCYACAFAEGRNGSSGEVGAVPKSLQNPQSKVTIENEIPGPQNLRYNIISDTRVELTWTADSSDNYDGFAIYNTKPQSYAPFWGNSFGFYCYDMPGDQQYWIPTKLITTMDKSVTRCVLDLSEKTDYYIVCLSYREDPTKYISKKAQGCIVNTSVFQGTITFNALHYSFENSGSVFKKNSGLDSNGKIPEYIYEKFYSKESGSAELAYSHAGTWGGSCYGFSGSTILYNYTPSTNIDLRLSRFEVSQVYALKPTLSSDYYGMSVYDTLNAIQISQRFTSRTHGVNDVYQAVKAGIDNSQLPIIGIWGRYNGEIGGHAIVGYKIETVSATEKRIYVYDPNYSKGSKRYITITVDANDTAESWYYYLNNSANWGTEYDDDDIAFFAASDVNNCWNTYLNPNGDRRREEWITSSDNANIAITDKSGRTLGEIQNGVFYSKDSSVYTIKDMQLHYSGDPIIYSKKADFRFINNASGKLSVDSAGPKQGVFISTDAKAVSLDISDENSQNVVTLEGKKDDCFEVTFRSGLPAASGKEKLKISGKSQGAEVRIGMSGSDVVVDNCTDISVSVNGTPVENLENLGKNINFYDVSLEYTRAAYTGKAVKPDIIIKGKNLTKGTDYTIRYENNIGSPKEKTEAVAIIQGTGKYSGTKTLTFTIEPGKKMTGSKIATIKDQAYSGKKITPKITVTYEGKKLVLDTDYTVSWTNNKNVGKATVTVTGKGIYTGTKTATFNIIPKSVKISSLKAGDKQLTVKWKKGSGIDGYEIEYSLKKNFKKSKKITVTKAKTTSTEIKKLKAKKTYYVRIRAFKKVKGKKYYSEWSKVLKKKVK